MKSKRIIAAIIIPILVLTFTLTDVKKAHAGIESIVLAGLGACVDVAIGVETSSTYQDWYENYYRPRWQTCMNQLATKVGFPAYFDSYWSFIGPDPIQNARLWMQSRNPGHEYTDDQVKSVLYQTWSDTRVNEDNDTFYMSYDLDDYLRYTIDSYLEYEGNKYIYSYNNETVVSQFTSAIMYVKTVDIVRRLQDNYYCLCVLRDDTIGPWLWAIEKSHYPYLVAVMNNNYRPPQMIKCQLYNAYTMEGITEADKFYYWDSNDKNYVEGDVTQKPINYYPYMTLDPELGFDMNTQATGWTRGCMFNVQGSTAFRFFRSTADITVQDVLYQPYYYNNQVFQTWNNRENGPYTLNQDNSNKTSYGDITSYIDSFNTENGYPPNPTQIEVHIIQENTPTSTPTPTPTPTPDPNNPSGGGTVSGGVVNNNNPTLNNNPSISNNPVFNNNPNINVTLFPSVSNNGLNGGSVSGNGGSGSSGNFFDWLGRVGDVIGNLIKGIGEALTGIFEGVAEAVTTIMESIPNILSPLFEFIFGGLPEEIKSLMTLGITCVIFIGVVKAIKR